MLPVRDEETIAVFPFATVAIVAVNLIVFIHQLFLPRAELEALVMRFGAVPYEIARFTHLADAPRLPNIATLFTSQFLHGGLFHLVGNLIYLWAFGRRVEAAVGVWRFTPFYLGCGAVAVIAQVVMTPSLRAPVIGASGAIAGVLGAYFLRFPLQRIRIWIPLLLVYPSFRVPAAVFLGLWFYLQWRGDGGAIAWYAHIGGFIAGAVLTLPARLRRR